MPEQDAKDTGSESQNEGTTGNTGDTSGSSADKGGELGDKGYETLVKERDARKTAEKELKKAQQELDQLRNATASESEKAIAKAKEEGKREALEVANKRVIKAAAIAAAAGKLANPSRAPQLLDLDSFEVDEDGEPDEKAIAKAIDDLLKTDPYLAAKAPAKKSGGDFSGKTGDGEDKVDMNTLLRVAATGHS